MGGPAQYLNQMVALTRLAMRAIELGVSLSFAVVAWFLAPPLEIGWRLAFTALAFAIAHLSARGFGSILLIAAARRARTGGVDAIPELRIVVTAKVVSLAGLTLGAIVGYHVLDALGMLACATVFSFLGSIFGARMGGIRSGRVLVSNLGSGRKREYIVNGQPDIPSMSTVIFATDISRGGSRGTQVALKTYRGNDPESRDLFIAEAHIWMNLGKHPHIASAEFIDELNHRLYLVAEYVEPDSLGRNTVAHFLNHGPVPLDTSLRWAAQICEAMRYTFEEKGLRAHGDLKPHNILITRQSNVKVTDFGLSRANASGVTTDTPKPRRRAFTADALGPFVGAYTGGTYGWMAPERFDGISDQRSDIYSFGIILWQMISGTADSPFDVDSVESEMRYNSTRDGHLTKELPAVNSPLWPVVHRCTQKRPEARPQTFAEVHELLRDIARQCGLSSAFAPALVEETGDDHHNRGLSFIHLGRYDEAVNCFDVAVTKFTTDPDRASAQLWRAHCLSNLGDYDRALWDCNDVINRLPKDPKGYLARSMMWLMRMCLDKAEEDARRAVKCAPLNKDARRQLAFILSTRRGDRSPLEVRGMQGEPPRVTMERVMQEGLKRMEATLTDPALFPSLSSPAEHADTRDDPDTRSETERRALIRRIQMFRTELSDSPVQKRADGDALLTAALTGNLDVLNAQVAAGADLNAHYRDGFTALMAASVKGHIDCVRILVAAGADLNERQNSGRTALFVVAETGNVDIIKMLGAAGADPNVADNHGFTALFYSAHRGNAEAAKALIDIGITVNTKDPNGITALAVAAEVGHVNCVEVLIAGKADANVKRIDGSTPLIRAAMKGHLACMKALMIAGADVNATDNDGDSVLMHAAYYGHVDCVSALIAAGADLTAKNKRGDTALALAQSKGHSDCVHALCA